MHTAGRNTFGFWKKDGALRCGFGLQKVTDAGTFPEGKQPAAIFRACAGGAYLLVCSDGECYVSAEGQSFLACGISFSCEPAFVRVFDEEPALLLSDGAQTAILTASGLQAEAGVPPFECAGYAYERLWIVPAAQGSRLQFSAPGNIRDFTEGRGLGGTIDVPDEKGNIVGFVPYKNDVLLLRERGGQLLEADGDERDFAVTDLFFLWKDLPEDGRIGVVRGCIYDGRRAVLLERKVIRICGRVCLPHRLWCRCARSCHRQKLCLGIFGVLGLWKGTCVERVYIGRRSCIFAA